MVFPRSSTHWRCDSGCFQVIVFRCWLKTNPNWHKTKYRYLGCRLYLLGAGLYQTKTKLPVPLGLFYSYKKRVYLKLVEFQYNYFCIHMAISEAGLYYGNKWSRSMWSFGLHWEKVPNVLSRCHTKRRTSARRRAHPSFGMTPTFQKKKKKKQKKMTISFSKKEKKF